MFSSAQSHENGLDVRRLFQDLLAVDSPDLYRKVIAEVDRVVLEECLRHVCGNQVHASELLGISRTTFRAKLKLAREQQPATPATPSSSTIEKEPSEQLVTVPVQSAVENQ
jgi:DNA-binding protein Fis